MSETLAELAQRHVLEGEERIQRQKRLIASLAFKGNDKARAQAEAFLQRMEAHQRETEQHLVLAKELEGRR